MRPVFSKKVTYTELSYIYFMRSKAQLKAEDEARQRKEAEEREAQQEKRREEKRQQKLVIKHVICLPNFSKDREEPLLTCTQSAASGVN